MSLNQPSAYPSELESQIALRNGRLLRVRPLRRCDEGPIHQLFRRLSQRTRYHRFFLPMTVLPESLLRLLICVDDCRRLALLAERRLPDGAEVVGLGNFGAIDDRTAEVGLVVADEWQRQGVGLALATRVLQAAEARGFDRFVAHMLSENQGIRRILSHVGRVLTTKMQHGVCEVSFVRRPAEPPSTAGDPQ